MNRLDSSKLQGLRSLLKGGSGPFTMPVSTALIAQRGGIPGLGFMDEAGALVKSLQVPPELAHKSPDADAEREDFHRRAYSSLRSLRVVLLSTPTTQQLVKDALLALSAFACEDGQDTPWTSPQLREVAESLILDLAAASLGGGTPAAAREQLVHTHIYEMLLVIQQGLRGGSRSASGQLEPSDTSRDILRAHQMAWIVEQVRQPQDCQLVVPCVLTALDHFSPAVKRQAMNSLVHLAQTMTVTQLRWYKDVVLDAVCHNLVGHEELWSLAVKVAVSLVTLIEGRNPRAPSYRRIFSEMLRQVELHQSDKAWRLPWLQEVGPLIEAMGLVLVLYLDRLLPLFFYWLECGDDGTTILVLRSLRLIIRMTWARVPHHASRIWHELDKLYQQKKDEGTIHAIVETRALLADCVAPDFEPIQNHLPPIQAVEPAGTVDATA